jgi:hypothetical protein
VAFGSRRISLVERSLSSFCFLWFCFICVLFVVLFRLCAGEDLPLSSGNADEGCKWEIQTDEGWVPYWESQV